MCKAFLPTFVSFYSYSYQKKKKNEEEQVNNLWHTLL